MNCTVVPSVRELADNLRFCLRYAPGIIHICVVLDVRKNVNDSKTLVGWLIRVSDKRANGFGALTGLVTGMITVFLFDRIYDNPTAGKWMMVAPWSEIPRASQKPLSTCG